MSVPNPIIKKRCPFEDIHKDCPNQCWWEYDEYDENNIRHIVYHAQCTAEGECIYESQH